MIVAIVLADQEGAPSDALFAENNDETAIERVTGTVLRGPFGGTLVAAHPTLLKDVQEALTGFAVQYVEISSNSNPSENVHSILITALKASDAFRTRWAKAMAAANGRFEKSGTQNQDAGNPNPSAEWSKLKQSADVKIRGLARSFDRDGVLIIPGDAAFIKKEHLAQMVEAFARDGQQPQAHPFAQAVSNGERSWPVIMSWEGAQEVMKLPPSTDFSKWLLQNLERVCDVKISG